MIEIKHLTKKYGNFVAVDHIDLSARNGEITILLGPNGAGKSTTIKSVAGLLKFDGEILIDGYPNLSLEAKRSFGYVAELPSFYDLLTVDEHLNFIEKAYNLEPNSEYRQQLLSRFELLDKRHKLAKELSKGMTQKLSLCCALLIRPQSLLVDEPMIGLDPVAIDQVLEVLVELKNENRAVLMSTHIIDMINDIWDVAYIMDKSKIVVRVEREQLKEGESLKQIFFNVVGAQHEQE